MTGGLHADDTATVVLLMESTVATDELRAAIATLVLDYVARRVSRRTAGRGTPPAVRVIEGGGATEGWSRKA